LLAAAIAVALAARLAYGPGTLGYDALWSLRWGDELLHGHQPAFEAALAPTPHPLANVVSAALSVFGTDVATTVLLALSWLSLGALAVALARLGAHLFGPVAGVVAAIAIVTRELLVIETGQALVDLPFLALCVAALDREVRHPREGIAVPVLLVLAGLLRPEAWALAAAYALYRPRAAWALLAPLAWMAFDLLATGDALHSLHGTQQLAAEFDRPTGADAARAPAALRDVVQTPLLWVALAGAAIALFRSERQAALPGAIIVLGLAGYLLLGAFDLPTLGRYLLLPAAMLCLFAGRACERGDPPLILIAAVGVLLVGVPGDVRRIGDARDFVAGRQAIQDDLRAAARATEHCAEATAFDRRSFAVVTAQRLGTRKTGGKVSFAPRDAVAIADYALGDGPSPTTGRVVYRGRFWVAAVSGACASA
jgi:hypothetical protein